MLQRNLFSVQFRQIPHHQRSGIIAIYAQLGTRLQNICYVYAYIILCEMHEILLFVLALIMHAYTLEVNHEPSQL